MDKTALKIVNLTDEKNDFAYWQSQPYATRLASVGCVRRVCLRRNAPLLEFLVIFLGGFWKNGREKGALRYR